MARNALEAVFGALGGGLVGYGKDKNLRMDREEERLARELAARQTADQRQIGLVSAGFEDEGTLRKRPATMRTAGAAAQAIPMSGTIGSALDVASRQMDSNITGGRRITLSDGTTYVQPYDRTPEGREERATTAARAKADRDREMLQMAVDASGLQPQFRPAVLSGDMTIAQALSEQRQLGVQERIATEDEELNISRRQRILVTETDRYLEAAGGNVDKAIQSYTQAPDKELTKLGLSVSRRDFDAAAERYRMRNQSGKTPGANRGAITPPPGGGSDAATPAVPSMQGELAQAQQDYEALMAEGENQAKAKRLLEETIAEIRSRYQTP